MPHVNVYILIDASLSSVNDLSWKVRRWIKRTRSSHLLTWFSEYLMGEEDESMKMGCVAAVPSSLTIFHRVLHRLPRFQPASPAPMLGVVVDKHVVWHCEDRAVHAHCARQDHLEILKRKVGRERGNVWAGTNLQSQPNLFLATFYSDTQVIVIFLHSNLTSTRS